MLLLTNINYNERIFMVQDLVSKFKEIRRFSCILCLIDNLNHNQFIKKLIPIIERYDES